MIRGLSSLIYRRMLASRGMRRRAWGLARSALIGLGDPLCVMRIHGVDALMPLSHRLPLNLAAHPLYDSQWARLAAFLRERSGGKPLTVVDVGANIGQIALALGLKPDDRVRAIEPSLRYQRCLCANLAHLPRAVRVWAALADRADSRPVRLVETGGTARFRPDAACEVFFSTLDRLLTKLGGLSHLDLLKIDTDGLDAQVLHGAADTIARCRPIVAWESGEFQRPGYRAETRSALRLLAETGYRFIVAYTHAGAFVGHFPLCSRSGDDLNPALTDLLFRSPAVSYFDLVALPPDMAEFAGREESRLTARNGGRP